MEDYYLIALRASIDAGSAIMEIYNRYLDVALQNPNHHTTNQQIGLTLKVDNSPLTNADLSAHNVIETALAQTQIPILSEEGRLIDYETRQKWERFWLVDPLDGTKEFLTRTGEFTVNIALIKNDKPVFGVIYQPVSDSLYFGIMGAGAYIIEQASLLNLGSMHQLKTMAKIMPSQHTELFTVVASRMHQSVETNDYINELETKHKSIALTSIGSSLKFCLIANGLAHEYPRFAPTMEWDTAAGQAILEAAGGKVTKPDGTPLGYNKPDLHNQWFVASMNK